MSRNRALKGALAVVGLIFVGLLYPMFLFMRQAPALAMMLSIYVTLGIFLFAAIRDPSASRTLISFTAWSSFAHAAFMGTQVGRHMIEPGELIGVGALFVIGITFLVLAPAKTVDRHRLNTVK